jgi:hypothetical protein
MGQQRDGRPFIPSFHDHSSAKEMYTKFEYHRKGRGRQCKTRDSDMDKGASKVKKTNGER